MRSASCLICGMLLAGCDSNTALVDGSVDAATEVDGAQAGQEGGATEGSTDAPGVSDAGLVGDQAAGDSAVVSCQPTAIQSKQDLIAVLDGLTWAGYIPGSLTNNAISAPCAIAQPLTVKAGDLALPSGCTENNGCLQRVLFSKGFSVDPLPTGVAFSDKVDVATTAYETLTLAAGVTVRFRGVMENTHPFVYNHVPQIMVEPDCATTCTEPATLCPKDLLCHGASGYCSVCLNLDKKQCACFEGAQLQEDGQDCSYISNTMSSICEGTCAAGVCTYAGTPDVYCP